MARCLSLLLLCAIAAPSTADTKIFERENLIAWCIVPFDSQKRGPEERAAMLEKLGIRQLAYDWRDEHVPTFDAEVAACEKHGVKLTAWWINSPELNEANQRIFDVVKRNQLKLQFWVMMPDPAAADQTEKVREAAGALRPFAQAAAKLECQVGLYNHGGWFGDPENQLAIIETLNLPNVGIVYNQHHGHAHVDRFAELLTKMKPKLLALNLNGMVRDGEAKGKKIVPIGGGELDLELLRAIAESGYAGPIGILNHTDEDAEGRLQDNLDGLEWLVKQLRGEDAGSPPKYRTYAEPAIEPVGVRIPYDLQRVEQLTADAQAHGNSARGAAVFSSARFACVSCHKIGDEGGAVGPDLTTVAACLKPAEIAEAVLYPKHKVKEGYNATAIETSAGLLHQGYIASESDDVVEMRVAPSQELISIPRSEIESRQIIGTLMPEGLAEAMTPTERADLVRFLLDLRQGDASQATAMLRHAHEPATFAYDFAPLDPESWPNRTHPVNRERLYDFYTKQADYFRTAPNGFGLLMPYPGIDGGLHGHWGNQNEATWADDRWNKSDLGSLLSGVFHDGELVIPRAVCVRLGENDEFSACFDPDTFKFRAVWRGGFVKFSSVRHGFMDGLLKDGDSVPFPSQTVLGEKKRYLGFHRHGRRVLFRYEVDGTEYLDSAWVEDGEFVHIVAPRKDHPWRVLLEGGSPQWPQEFVTRGELGVGSPYALDTVSLPTENPWNALMFFGGHDFLADGTAMLCTMQGDVWSIRGLDNQLENVRWRRFASGLHHAQGVVVHDDHVYVLGRDQITRLHDVNHDGEADYYECFSNAYTTSAAGHDFICGLERDAQGRFYTASGNEGLLRISADGRSVECLATGFRNPDGLGLFANGDVTVPCSEGEWTPTSMICQIPARRGTNSNDSALKFDTSAPPFYGYLGPRDDASPQLPLVYLPRGSDNSAGGQVEVTSERWGPLKGAAIHFSYGAGTHFLLLRDVAKHGPVPGQVQGAIVPLPGDFLSGAHRGRFAPHDGQLYVSGMGGWGTYTVADGAFQRVRYTGAPVQLPIGFSVRENGVLVEFSEELDPSIAGDAANHFAQAWNYHYSSAYGSQEYSISHPDTPAHDRVHITAAHVLKDGRTLFLEMPDVQPVNQLHLRLSASKDRAVDLFLTVHGWNEPFTEFPGYAPRPHVALPHPMLADLARIAQPKLPNPWREPIENARVIELHASKNLTFSLKTFTASPGEPLALTFKNPDVVPHNWVLLRPGSMARVGDLANRLISAPDAAVRNYAPESDDVLAYVDVTPPGETSTIYLTAPSEPGSYPFICSFPGHWMVMNGQMVVGGSTTSN